MRVESEAKVVNVENIFTIERLDVDGNVIERQEVCNAVTSAALNTFLNTFFGSDVKRTNWYIGLISGVGYTGTSTSDTLASHAGWTEWTYVSESPVRREWVPTVSTAQSVTSTTVATFTITSQGNGLPIQGVFVTDVASGTSGLLWATGLFSTPSTVTTGQDFRVTYTVRVSN